ncbi:MAG: tRNA (adenosine(37)-N6)-threonylcarbamoyltransferase complex dimerization subunit type 1 TsaB [Candidatus Methylacidiphilales bacterium]
MTHILCIETATEICSVAIAKDGETIALVEDTLGNNHANQLHILVAKALIDASLLFTDLNAVAVSKGPGSYTGLRVGVSTAKGYCYALQIPLIAINTLQSLANGFWQNNPSYTGLVCPMIDARRMEVYCALFNQSLHEVLPTQAKIIDEQSFVEELSLNQITFIGNGAAKCENTIHFPNAHFKNEIRCNASNLSELANQAFNQQQFEDVAYFEPYYLKDFVGTVAKKLV